MAAARRGNRTILVAELGAPNLYANAEALLDAGFSGALSGTGDLLPPVRSIADPVADAAPVAQTLTEIPGSQGSESRLALLAGTVLLATTVLISARRRRIAARRARRAHLTGRAVRSARP